MKQIKLLFSALLFILYLLGSQALAQIAFVKNLTPNQSKTSGTSIAATVPAGGVTAGNSIIVSLAMDPASGTVSCTDSASNSYAVDRDQINGSGTSGVRTVVFSAHNVNALVSGNTITCTHPSATARALSASEFSGLAVSGTKDQATSLTGNSTSPSSGTTGMTTQANELLIGAIGVEGPNGDSFTPGANYSNTGGRIGTTGGNAATNITINPEYRIVSAANAYSANATLGNSRQWSAAIVTYKGKPPPVINNLSFTSGPIGTPITINGSNFGATQGTSTVTFNGNTATPTNWSASSITVPVPVAASTGPVVVTVGGAASNGITFTLTYSPRVNAGALSSYTDGSGNYWAADREYQTGPWGYTAGSIFSTGDPIANTTDDALYQSERFGTFGYKFDLPNGKYDVTLHFAEIWFGSPPGQRVFKVLIENTVMLDNYDIYAQVGHDVATTKSFYGVDVLDGQLNIDFVSITNNPKISAISVLPTRPTKLVVTSVNSGNTPTAGVAFPVTIQAQNPNGVPTNATVATNISLSVESGAGTLGGTFTGTLGVGSNQLVISGVTYSKNDYGVVLKASATSGESLTPGTSSPFNVAIGSPTKLGFIFQPTNSTTSGAIKGPPTVAVQDSAGNTITTSTASITIAIGTNPGGGTLSGTTVKNASNGAASFADLHINNAANGYTLTATSSGLTSATTNTFNVTAAGNVAGTVTKAAGGGAITAALVEALQSGVVQGSASTNSSGSYTITGLVPGVYDIRGTAGGFTPQTQTSVTVSGGATATSNFSLNVATPTAGIVYLYDELQRLKSVIDPVGEAATYSYDAVGNLLGITRNSGTQTSVIDFNPNSGPIGSTVTIYGTGYSTTPSQNTVTFNGVAATVISSTLTQITTTVPAGATTGTIAVTSPAGAATSSMSFAVSGSPPSITSFTPNKGIAGTSVTINGSNFSSTPADNVVQFNRLVTASVSTSTTTSIQTTVPIGTQSGAISVSTSTGIGKSSQDFFIVPSPYTAADVDFTGRITAGGSSLNVTIATNKIGLIVFDGLSGQRVSLQISGVTIPNSDVWIRTPTGVDLAGQTYVSTSGVFIDAITLPTAATYTILVDPRNADSGSMTLTLHNAQDYLTTMTPGGPPVTVATKVPGQNARVTFSGTVNQRVSLQLTNPTNPNSDVWIINPGGSYLVPQTYVGSGGAYIDAQTLLITGPYTILVSPRGTETGSMTLTLYDVPPDYTVPITAGGQPVAVATSVPGQNARATFSGTANQRVSLQITNVKIANSDASIQKPDGTNLVSPNYVYSDGIFIDTVVLPTSGTYTIFVNPRNLDFGSVTLTLYDVPADYSTTITPGGSATATNTVPGQNAQATFTGTANQRVSLLVNNVTIPNSDVWIRNPDQQTYVVPQTYVGIGGAYIDTVVLPATGTYTILVNPRNLDMGSMTLNLYDVIDVTGSLSVNGSSVPVSLTTLGQRAILTFSGNNGQQVTVRITGNTIPYVFVELRRFDGTLLTWNASGSGSFDLSTQTLPGTETYSIVVDPPGMFLGNLSVSVTSP